MTMPNTDQQFYKALQDCKKIFIAKLKDYGPSWRIMRPTTVTDQLLIKATRIRTLETKKQSLVNEGILPEFMALVNYGIIGLIQLSLGSADYKDLSIEEAESVYDKYANEVFELMKAKNHDYDEAWRVMRISSYTDMILTKLMRVKEIEGNCGQTVVSEGIDSNYMDLVNYAVFGIIKLTEGHGSKE